MSSNRLVSLRVSCIAFAVFISCCAFQSAHAQGCIAARSNQGIMGELCDGDTVSSSSGRNHDPEWLRRLTVNIGFRDSIPSATSLAPMSKRSAPSITIRSKITSFCLTSASTINSPAAGASSPMSRSSRPRHHHSRSRRLTGLSHHGPSLQKRYLLPRGLAPLRSLLQMPPSLFSKTSSRNLSQLGKRGSCLLKWGVARSFRDVL